jgi:hypothetical protein
MAGPSLGGDHVALRVLTTLLRSRPQTLQALRELRSLPTDDLDGVLERLVRSGFIELAGDRISYHAPERAIEAQVAALADLVTVLPDLTREWRRGADAAVEAELVHGHEEQWRAWARYAALTPPVAPLNLYPTLDVLRDVIAPTLADAVTPYREGMNRSRAVIPASVVITEDDRRVMDLLTAAGMSLRLARSIDSWLYSDPEVLCALPVVWGEHPPTSIIIIRDPAIRAVTAAYAEQVWVGATPYCEPQPEWLDVLRLLSLGMTDKEIAASQNTSQRTVERRIAEAMAHYRVTTRFELGMAWAAEQTGRGPVGIQPRGHES